MAGILRACGHDVDTVLEESLGGRDDPTVLSAAKESMAVASKTVGKRPLPIGPLLRPSLLRLVMAVAPRVVPFDLETYFRVHFTKVGDQTRLMLTQYLRHGRDHGLPVTSLETLVRALPLP